MCARKVRRGGEGREKRTALCLGQCALNPKQRGAGEGEAHCPHRSERSAARMRTWPSRGLSELSGLSVYLNEYSRIRTRSHAYPALTQHRCAYIRTPQESERASERALGKGGSERWAREGARQALQELYRSASQTQGSKGP